MRTARKEALWKIAKDLTELALDERSSDPDIIAQLRLFRGRLQNIEAGIQVDLLEREEVMTRDIVPADSMIRTL